MEIFMGQIFYDNVFVTFHNYTFEVWAFPPMIITLKLNFNINSYFQGEVKICENLKAFVPWSFQL